MTVIHPSIAIEKGPNSQTVVGGTSATFSITVTNDGDAVLDSVHVGDAQAPGCSRTAAQIAADPNGNGTSTLAPSESYSYSCSLANVSQSFTNSATATGTPPVGQDVDATDTADVTVINPSIGIVKGPDSQTIVAGGTATFQLTVTNTGDSTLTSVHVDDAQAPGCSRSAAQVAADHGTSTFAPQESYAYSCTLANVHEELTNSATATGTPAAGSDVTATDTAQVEVINPAIDITKGPDGQTRHQRLHGEFSITVKNTGDAQLTSVHVADAQAAGCARTAAQIATDRGSSTFAPGASYTYSCTSPNATTSFTNSATATGTRRSART